MKTTGFDLRHCSLTMDQPCDTDADCSEAVCGDCRPNEVCLTAPHCAKHVEVACGNDADCGAHSTGCPACTEDEDCVRVLEQREIFLRPGESADLFHQPVTLRNVTGTTAKIKDTWTANVLIPQFSVDNKLKYSIKGRPGVQPAPQ